MTASTSGYLGTVDKPVYYPIVDNLTIFRIWSGDGNAAPDDVPRNIFTGETNELGIQQHVNGAPDTETLAGWNVNTTGDPVNATADQFSLSAWLYIDQDNTQLRDNSGFNGERMQIFIGREGGSIKKVFENDVATTPGAPNVGIFATVNKGWHYFELQASDSDNAAGVLIEKDNGGDNNFSIITDNFSSFRPVYTCRKEPVNFVPVSPESDCPLTDPLVLRHVASSMLQVATGTKVCNVVTAIAIPAPGYYNIVTTADNLFHLAWKNVVGGQQTPYLVSVSGNRTVSFGMQSSSNDLGWNNGGTAQLVDDVTGIDLAPGEDFNNAQFPGLYHNGVFVDEVTGRYYAFTMTRLNQNDEVIMACVETVYSP